MTYRTFTPKQVKALMPPDEILDKLSTLTNSVN